jgi:hypothetical protein
MKGTDTMSTFLRSLAVAAVLGTLSAASAGATTLDFGTLPNESVNGVTANGITFGYTEFGSPSPEAFFNVNVGAGATQNIPGAALVGMTDGVLTLNFATPIEQLSFDVAETTNLTLTPGYTVSLFDTGGDLLQTTNVETDPLVFFTEGEFNYDGAPASTVEISFDPNDANQFAIGPLTFVPEPSSTSIFVVGLALLGLTAARRRQV